MGVDFHQIESVFMPVLTKNLTITSNHYAVYEFDGAHIHNEAELFAAFNTAMKFPSYFGKNYPAFRDLLGDTSWMANFPQPLIIIFHHSEQLNVIDWQHGLASLMELFKLCVNDSADPFQYYGNPPPKGVAARALFVIFHSLEGNFSNIISACTAEDIETIYCEHIEIT